MYNLTSKARGLLCKQVEGLVSIPVHPSLVVTKLSAKAITWFPHSFGLGLWKSATSLLLSTHCLESPASLFPRVTSYPKVGEWYPGDLLDPHILLWSRNMAECTELGQKLLKIFLVSCSLLPIKCVHREKYLQSHFYKGDFSQGGCKEDGINILSSL